MNVQEFKRRLIALEAQLSAPTERGRQAARAQVLDSPMIKNVKFVELPGGPHGVLWTHAERINSELVTFLA